MGQLDDAIREHLELKRRRGADATEVARQEQEAFGPPRRGDVEGAPVAVAPGPELDEPALDDPAAFADEPAPTALHVVEDRPHAQEEPPRPNGDPAEQLPHATPEPVHKPAPAPVHEPEPAPVLQDEPPRPHGDPADDLPAVEDQPTRAFDAEEVRAATTPPPPAPAEPVRDPEPAPAGAARMDEEDEGGDDVLEETPEFLQETPEHDRLWFEQRPPRDFDF